MKLENDAIQIWTAQQAPEFYRRLSQSSSELDWIAVVQPNAVHDFGHILFMNGYQIGKDTISHALSDGAWMFCGPLAK